ncbi:hypothetical protein SAMN05444392_102452 [Seinonella peptonophila]|uniref:Uncharacterized protein n=1 Tax=Seinonella peptonophila TaxID=112248 RepID=A0A1M4VNZ4_9BACL|nr:hypothetical protein [Seinonella peptonophila]SHE70560.1 hypothetical protein SAMN05444392_102452 [Seinonella peptonophila]
MGHFHRFDDLLYAFYLTIVQADIRTFKNWTLRKMGSSTVITFVPSKFINTYGMKRVKRSGYSGEP